VPVLKLVDESRRSFLSKLILGSAFAAPSVASFSMSGLAVGEASAQCANMSIFFCSNQTSPNCSLIANGVTETNFHGCSYAGRNFHGFILSNNCFEGTDFAGANLSHSDLSCDNLIGANLPGANLNGAILENAILTDANLAGANLNNANLIGANLQYATLTGANLHGANLQGADLTGAILTGANNSQGANLTNVTWSGTTCPDGTDSDSNGVTCIGHLTPV
jgi:uncharacterized protein YjbI with pentapeptide repeats